MQVRDFWHENQWDSTKVHTMLGPLGVPEALRNNICNIPFDVQERDTPRWDLTPHGNFTTSSAWNLTRHRQPQMDIFKAFWSPAISPSISIFMWRLIANRIPVDVKLQWRNIHLASKCRCCRDHEIETLDHLFWRGSAANRIWSFFASWFPDAPNIHYPVSALEFRLRFWQMKLGISSSAHVCIVIPCFILWFIWLERNNVIHRGSFFSPHAIIDRIITQLQGAITAGKLPKHLWQRCFPTVNFVFPTDEVRRLGGLNVIRWEPPPHNWIKLNTDGAFSRHGGGAGGGGIIRDSNGRILWGFAISFEASSALEAEFKALDFGIRKAVTWDRKIWVEVDATEVVHTLERKKHGAAAVRHHVVGIRRKLRATDHKISHVFREGNKIAHWLAQAGSARNEQTEFEEQTAPNEVKAMAALDHLGIPNLRRNNDDRPP